MIQDINSAQCIGIYHIFLIFKLCSTTEQMPALVCIGNCIVVLYQGIYFLHVNGKDVFLLFVIRDFQIIFYIHTFILVNTAICTYVCC
jgi:hypothetical protein